MYLMPPQTFFPAGSRVFEEVREPPSRAARAARMSVIATNVQRKISFER